MPRNAPRKKFLEKGLIDLYFFLKDLDLSCIDKFKSLTTSSPYVEFLKEKWVEEDNEISEEDLKRYIEDVCYDISEDCDVNILIKFLNESIELKQKEYEQLELIYNEFTSVLEPVKYKSDKEIKRLRNKLNRD